MNLFRTRSQKSLLTYEKDVHKSTILVGPDSVGKWYAADLLSRSTGTDRKDILSVDTPLTGEVFEAIESFAKHPPKSGRFRFVLIRVKNVYSDTYARLLKILEDSSSTTKFIITMSQRPPRTLSSRSKVVKFGKLNNEELKYLMVERFSVDPKIADQLVKHAGGTIDGALKFLRTSTVRDDVLSVTQAIQVGDETSLLKYATTWTDMHTEILRQWAEESLTEPVVFDADQLSSGRRVPVAILTELRDSPRARYIVRNNLRNVMEVAKIAR